LGFQGRVESERKDWSVKGFRAAVVCVAGLCLSLSLACEPAPPDRVAVVFLLDTLRQDALGCYGNPRNPTPHIDALAHDGARFEHAISSSGWTLPAIGSLLTGTWPTIHGAMGKGVMLTPIRDELPTAAEVFREHGHRTVAIANAAFVSPMVGVQRGFDVFDHQYSYNDDARTAGEVVDLAIAQLDARGEGSSFFLFHLFDPHLTYDPPADFAGKYTGGRASPPLPITAMTCLQMQTGARKQLPPSAADQEYVRAAYLAEVSYMDSQVGRFVAALRERGLYEDTTLVVTSDHGEEFWEHRGFEHGHSLYDELVRVPLIIKPPRDLEFHRKVVTRSVRLMDIMPTIFELHGVPKPPSFEGESLLSLMQEDEVAPRPVFSESTLYGPERIAWRTEQYKYIHDATLGPGEFGELYDWRADPGETRNLARDRPEVAMKMRDELLEFYYELQQRSGVMSTNAPVDLSPVRIRQLRSLGYIR